MLEIRLKGFYLAHKKEFTQVAVFMLQIMSIVGTVFTIRYYDKIPYTWYFDIAVLLISMIGVFSIIGWALMATKLDRSKLEKLYTRVSLTIAILTMLFMYKIGGIDRVYRSMIAIDVPIPYQAVVEFEQDEHGNIDSTGYDIMKKYDMDMDIVSFQHTMGVMNRLLTKYDIHDGVLELHLKYTEGTMVRGMYVLICEEEDLYELVRTEV